MKPEELSRALRRLADGIDRADSPSAVRVALEMRRLLASVEALPQRYGPRMPVVKSAPAVTASRSPPADVSDDGTYESTMERLGSPVPKGGRIASSPAYDYQV